jgi:MFS transporter, FSR family, fosmidomycin resistance protein
MPPHITTAEAAVSPIVSSRVRTGWYTLVLLSLGHFFIDLYSSALSVFQPLLGQKLGLTLTQAGILGGMIGFSGSVMQPLYGYLSDRYRTKLFAALSPAVAGIFISCLGVAPSFPWLLVLVVLGGAGIAAFHPQASSRATEGVETGRGRWMAFFISSGSLGLAVGPTYFSLFLGRFGLPLSYWAAVPGVLMTLFLLIWLPPVQPHATQKRAKFDWRPLVAVWKPLTVLYMLVFIRSILQITFAQLLPLYLSRERGYTLANASYALSLYLAFGALGGFAGGHLADRFGGRRLILWSMLGSTPLLAMFFFVDGPLALVGLALGGLVLLCTTPVNVVMAQELAPSQAGTVSALMMGFAWGMAGLLFIPFTGWASEIYTMHHVLSALLIFPLFGAWLTTRLPR